MGQLDIFGQEHEQPAPEPVSAAAPLEGDQLALEVAVPVRVKARGGTYTQEPLA